MRPEKLLNAQHEAIKKRPSDFHSVAFTRGFGQMIIREAAGNLEFFSYKRPLKVLGPGLHGSPA